MAVKHIAVHNNELITAREICDQFQTPFDTMSKVLQQLGSSGILQSSQGVKGGYKLVKPLDMISLKDFLITIDGECSKLCSGDSNCALSKQCNIIDPMTKLNLLMCNFIQEISLADLLTNKTE